MENATKALLIAAAVLIAIILISLGVSIVSSAQDQINQSSSALDTAEIESFNSKFRSYEGTAVSGTKCKTLARAVVQNNLSQADESKRVNLYIDGAVKIASTATNPTVPSEIGSGYRYDVECKTDASGLIKDIYLKKKQ